MKGIIWSNNPYDVDYDEIIADYRECMDDDEISEDRIINAWYEINADMLDDIRASVSYAEIGDIICFADLGLWDGRRPAWKEIDTLKDCFYSQTDSMCYDRWYVEGKDLKCDEAHHDGTNHYTFRAVKPTLTEQQKQNFEDRLYAGITEEQINYYTEPLGELVEQIIY